ncbi:unnamed protein product [Fraxinus pennsylvanica]|uniref:Glycoside hydrolase family 19 catalytic domain-containing protein n=1 Tax=Fraxinus pennsylvanica TaxID=56036 RepID=A0AAD1ZZL1_9LAMI|nr:unnamed protein product [Fraxinus pennsylvanica]
MPSWHDAISGRWTPSTADLEAEQVSGYGVVTNIINGGNECGKVSNSRVEDRIGFYKRYCDLLGVGYGPNCYNQMPFTLTQEWVGSIISKFPFDQMLKNHNDGNCSANGFYTYEAFIAATNSFGAFGTTAIMILENEKLSLSWLKRGWAFVPNGPYSWGYCFKQEHGNPMDYCVASPRWPCAPGKRYFSRGPIRISYNYNYAPAGRAIGSDLLNNPDAVANDPTISFKTALWFWMTPQAPMPSWHDAISGRWTPSTADLEAEQVSGYGVVTNIINGGNECGKGSNSRVEDRIGFYKRYCDLLGVGYGPNLDCYNQMPFTLTQEWVGSIISKSPFDQMLKNRNDGNCPANGFYTYEAFIAATNSFGAFGTRAIMILENEKLPLSWLKRGWAFAPDGPYSWGYCFKQEHGNPMDYCVASPRWPCAPGKKYFSRGPIQISYNYNYAPAGRAIGSDLLNNPDAVANDPTISFKTALWFWMTPQAPMPSWHDAISGRWTPSTADLEAEQVSGYGVVTNIINGGNECGKGSNSRVEDRIGFYKRYCDLLGVGYGPNLDCYNQRPFTLTQEFETKLIHRKFHYWCF